VKERGLLLYGAVRNAARKGAAYGRYISSASAQQQRDGASGGSGGSVAVGASAPASRRRNLPVTGAAGGGDGGAVVPPGAAAGAVPSDAGSDVEGGLLDAAPDVGTCPVCPDALTNGVSLECSHVFCEDCICEWLERHRTCPMCRAEVKPAGLSDHTDGTSSLLPILF
jgi:hypothetical protein